MAIELVNSIWGNELEVTFLVLPTRPLGSVPLLCQDWLPPTRLSSCSVVTYTKPFFLLPRAGQR